MDDVHVLKDEQNHITITVKKTFQPELNSHFYNWVIDGVVDHIHNPHGPAFIMYDAQGSVIIEQWWLDGKLLTGEDLEKIKHKVSFINRVEDLLD